MREIRFRAIHKLTKHWFEDTHITYQDGEWFEDYRALEDWRPVNLEQVAIMQYTGLKDRNGMDIYERDIIRITNNLQENEVDYIAQIIFKDGGFCAIDGNEDDYGVRRYRLSDFGYELKIIGNIYENPELLERE